jgi:DNA/RNA-binding domain of Phe-tRNA-synthetase-like protein
MTVFQYHPEILSRFPGIVGGVILAESVANGPTPEALWEAYLEEQRTTLVRIGETPLSELEPLAAWRAVFRGFGVNPTKYRSAAEALLRRLTKKGDIPSINALVDICNLVSIRYAIPIAAFDMRALQAPITVHLADGTERFTNLGQEEVEHPEPGEVVFSDETGLVVARRWCWRQSDESASRPDTTHAVITAEAFHETARMDVRAALDDLLALLREHVGGSFSSDVLGVDHPAM